MVLRRARRVYDKNWNEILGILLRKYPPFVLSDRVTTLDEIPVFVFHDVASTPLEPVLGFLAENRYITLTADEYLERRLHGERGQDREVLLTFDDGHRSLHTVAYPALTKFNLRAVAYIVPGMIAEATAAHAGSDTARLCNWDEIREMHESGRVDFQSHSMFHHSIPVSDKIVDFVRPRLRLSFLDSDLSPVVIRNGEARKFHELPYGMPIYAWAPRYGGARAYRADPAVSDACTGYVTERGGADYFLTAGWERRLKAVAESAQRKVVRTFESEDEQRSAILSDFADSKKAIDTRLPAKTVRHFCYPWFRGTALAARLSVEAGYATNAWGSLLPEFLGPLKEPVPVARLLFPYVWRLPGLGRRPLGAVLREKWLGAPREIKPKS